MKSFVQWFAEFVIRHKRRFLITQTRLIELLLAGDGGRRLRRLGRLLRHILLGRLEN